MRSSPDSMPSLRELQLSVVAALHGEDAAALELWVAEPPPAPCLQIYRDNLQGAFRKALALEFPAIETLVGAECFTALAADLQRKQPSRSGDLQHIGAAFAPFLAQRFAGTRYACFEAVARLEWALQEVTIAADATTLQPIELTDVAPEHYGDLRLRLHPACRVLRSRYPAQAIWNANNGPSPPTDTIDLDTGGDLLLVRRVAQGAVIERLGAGECALLEAFADGLTLGAALEAALAAEAGFDLAACLQRCCARGVFESARAQAASDSFCGRPIA